MDPREQQIKAAAEQLAAAVYGFLTAGLTLAVDLNTQLLAVQAAHGPLPAALPLIPLPPAALTMPDQLFSTPVKQAPRKALTFPGLDASPLWSPVALLQQQLMSASSLARGVAPNGGARQPGRKGGHHSPPKFPPPLFDGAPAAQQQHGAALHPGLVHWKSDLSANMAALGAVPTGGGAAIGGGAAGSPINSPRAAALMAVCQEAEAAPGKLARLTSTLSSQAEALGEPLVPPALAKQKSDLADLATMAAEELEAARGAHSGEAAGGEAPAAPAAMRSSPPAAAREPAAGDERAAAAAADKPAEPKLSTPEQQPSGKRCSEGHEGEAPEAKRLCAGSNSPQLEPEPGADSAAQQAQQPQLASPSPGQAT